MKKTIILLPILFAVCLLVNISQAYSQKRGLPVTQARGQVLFNNGWKFFLGDNPDFRHKEFDDSGWRRLNLPHDWSIEEDYCSDCPTGRFNGFFKEGIGWYRKTFTLPDSLKDKQVVVQFDGVFMNSDVWINGRFMGRRPYGYSTFQYDITDYVKTGGKKNVIAVRVDNSLPEASRWYNGSGIYRNVHLITTNYTHFNNYNGIFITTPIVEKEKAVVRIDHKIMANFLTEEELRRYRRGNFDRKTAIYNCRIRSTVYNQDGVEVSSKVDEVSIESLDRHVEYQQEVVVNAPHLWSAEVPYMYYLKSEIVLDDKVLDDKVTPFGIRRIAYNPQKGLLVNGVQTKLQGVCIHHDAGSLGAAVPEKVLEYRLKKLKEMGCNAIRTSHNPFAPEFYDMCDTLGFYVMDECFDEWKDGWNYNFTENQRGKTKSGYHLYFNQWAETDLTDMIHRDRNHPSVILYGIGNEIPYFRDSGSKDVTRKLVSICHREDNTRPVALGDNSATWTHENGTCKELDIIGYNYIMRYHPDSLYAPKRKAYPDKLFFGSETDRDIRYYLAYRDNDYVIGQFIWAGIDYLGETKRAPQRGWQYSLLDVCCNPRPTGLLFDCCWHKEPKIHVVAGLPNNKFSKQISWNWKEGETVSVDVYNNCDEVELFLNGRSLGRKTTHPDKYCTSFETTYKPGKLVAKGYKKESVVTTTLYTAGKAAKIKACPQTTLLRADGRDVAIFEVSVCDKKGITVPDADNNVAVEVKGAAKFIGMDTRNLFYTGNFKTPNRKATNGKLIVYIQALDTVGEAQVTFTSEGLQSETVTLSVSN